MYYENIFSKCCKSNQSEEIFVIKKAIQGYVIVGRNSAEIDGKFYEQELQKNKNAVFMNEKMIKKKLIHCILYHN